MCLVPSNCTQKTRANSRQHTRKENERKITIKVQHNPPKANVSVTINFYTFFMQKRNKEKLWNESTTHPRTHLICGLFIHIFNALMQFLCHRNKILIEKSKLGCNEIGIFDKKVCYFILFASVGKPLKVSSQKVVNKEVNVFWINLAAKSINETQRVYVKFSGGSRFLVDFRIGSVLWWHNGLSHLNFFFGFDVVFMLKWN